MSMRENELRVGVYIYYLEEVFKVDAECISMHWGDDLDDAYRPIPITEEWLLKFGFEFGMKFQDFVKGKYKFTELKNKNLYGEFSEEGIFYFNTKTKIKYVHQLQNLYFALTGEELTIKDEN